jgi:hypothetical protein
MLKGITIKESGALLFDFYQRLTASEAPVKERSFQEYYQVERTLSDEMFDHLCAVYSAGDHKAFTLRHFKELHSFKGKEYGWPDLHLHPHYQVF